MLRRLCRGCDLGVFELLDSKFKRKEQASLSAVVLNWQYRGFYVEDLVQRLRHRRLFVNGYVVQKKGAGFAPRYGFNWKVSRLLCRGSVAEAAI